MVDKPSFPRFAALPPSSLKLSFTRNHRSSFSSLQPWPRLGPVKHIDESSQTSSLPSPPPDMSFRALAPPHTLGSGSGSE